MDDIVKTIITAISSFISITSILVNSTKLYKTKGIISKNQLKIVEIKHKSPDYNAWKKQKKFYFAYLIILQMNIYLLISISIIFHFVTLAYIFYIAFITIISSLFTALYFALYKTMGNTPDDGKYIASNEVEIKINADKQNLFYYVQLALCAMHAHTFDLNTDNGFLEVFIKQWRIFPYAILNIYIQQIEEATFLLRVTAHGIYPSRLIGNQYNSRVINQFIRQIIPTIEEVEESKKEDKYKEI